MVISAFPIKLCSKKGVIPRMGEHAVSYTYHGFEIGMWMQSTVSLTGKLMIAQLQTSAAKISKLNGLTISKELHW